MKKIVTIMYILQTQILVGYLFTVLRPAQEYFTYMVKGCKILAYAHGFFFFWPYGEKIAKKYCIFFQKIQVIPCFQ
jgi:hypothetical protein